LKVPIGIAGLDSKLDGGIPEKSTILLIGPPGAGKSTMCQQFIATGLKQKQPAIYMTSDIGPKKLKSDMKSFGWKTNGNIRFIDVYSWRTGSKESEYAVGNLGNINELNIQFTKAMKSFNGSPIKRDALDSISTLLLYADPSLVIRLIPVISAKAKKAGYTQLMVLEEGVHDKKTITALNYLADGIIEFKIEESKRFMRIARMRGAKHSRDWIEFKITNRGIKV